MMTRTLKYTPVVETFEPTDVAEGDHESTLHLLTGAGNITRRSLSLCEHSAVYCSLSIESKN